MLKILQGTWLSLTNSSGCWELLNILGDLSSPPRDSDVVSALLDAGAAAQCMLATQARFAVFTWLANFMAHLPVWMNPSHLQTSLPLSLPTPSLYLSLRDGLGVWYTFVLGGSGPRAAEMLE